MVFKILHIITSTTTADMYVTRLINYYNSVFRILNWDDIPYYSFLSFFYQLYNYFSGKSIIISRAHVLNSFIHPASGQKNFKQEVKKNINNNNFLLFNILQNIDKLHLQQDFNYLSHFKNKQHQHIYRN